MREKLIELVGQVQDCGCDVTDVVVMNYVENEVLVDHLIANGVTFAEDNNVPSKWIPVTEGLPEEGKEVLALCWHHESWQPHVCYLSTNFKGRWITSIAGQWMMNVSHWMHLPEPPKGKLL